MRRRSADRALPVTPPELRALIVRQLAEALARAYQQAHQDECAGDPSAKETPSTPEARER